MTRVPLIVLVAAACNSTFAGPSASAEPSTAAIAAKLGHAIEAFGTRDDAWTMSADELSKTFGLDADHFTVTMLAPDLYTIFVVHYADPKLGDYRPRLTSVMHALGAEHATIAAPAHSWPRATLANSDARWPRASVELTVSDGNVADAVVDNVVLTHRGVRPTADAKTTAILAAQLRATLEAAKPGQLPALTDILHHPPFEVEQPDTIFIRFPQRWIDASALVRLLGGFNAKDLGGQPVISSHGVYVVIHRYPAPRQDWLRSVELALP